MLVYFLISEQTADQQVGSNCCTCYGVSTGMPVLMVFSTGKSEYYFLVLICNYSILKLILQFTVSTHLI